MIRYNAPGIRRDQGDPALGIGARAVPVVLAVDVGDEVGVGRQLGLIPIVSGCTGSGRAWRRTRSAAGTWRPAYRRARRTAPWPGRRAASRMVRSSPACLPETSTVAPHSCSAIEDIDARRPLGIEAVELEAAVADRDLVEIAAPGGVDRLDVERREDEAVGDRLPIGPLDAPLDRHPGRRAAATSWGGSPALTS